MAFTQFSKGIVYINGKQLTMASKITLKRETGSKQVNTIALGYAGESPGSPMMTGSVTSAIPSQDFELDPGSFMADLKQCTVTLFAGNRPLTFDATITGDSDDFGVDAESTLNFDFRAAYVDWE